MSPMLLLPIFYDPLQLYTHLIINFAHLLFSILNGSLITEIVSMNLAHFFLNLILINFQLILFFSLKLVFRILNSCIFLSSNFIFRVLGVIQQVINLIYKAFSYPYNQHIIWILSNIV
jgi:hypothetical protein